MSFRRFLAFLVCIFSINAFALETERWKPKETWFYGGAQLGKSFLSTEVDGEAGDKDGIQYGLLVSALLDYETFQVNVSASYYFLNFESERVGDVQYDLETQTLAIEASPLWSIGNKITIGPKLQYVLTERMLVGPSDSSNETDPNLTTNKIFGVNAFMLQKFRKFDLRFGAHLHKPFDIGSRDVTIVLFSLELGQKLNF